MAHEDALSTDDFSTSTSLLVQLILALFIFYGAMSSYIALTKTGTLKDWRVQLALLCAGAVLVYFSLGAAIVIVEPAILRLFGAGGQGFLHLLSLRVTDPRDLSLLGVLSRLVAGIYTSILSSIFGVPLLLALLAYAVNMYDALSPPPQPAATTTAAAAAATTPNSSGVLARPSSDTIPEETGRFLLSEFDMDAFHVLCPLGTGITSSVVLAKVVKPALSSSAHGSLVAEQTGSLFAALTSETAAQRGSLWVGHRTSVNDDNDDRDDDGRSSGNNDDLLDQVLETVELERSPFARPFAFAPGGPPAAMPPLDPGGWRRVERSPARPEMRGSPRVTLDYAKSPIRSALSGLSLEEPAAMSMKKTRSIVALSEMAGDVSEEQKWWRKLQWLDEAQRTKSGMDEVFAVAPGLASAFGSSARNLSDLALARRDGSQLSFADRNAAPSPSESRRSLSDASQGGLPLVGSVASSAIAAASALTASGVVRKSSVKFSSGTDLSEETFEDEYDRGKAGLEEMPELVAVKIMHKAEIEKMGMRRTVENERRLLVSCSSPFVCNVFGAFQDAHWAYIILEPVPAGDLAGLLEQRQVMFEDEARFFIGCLLLALEHLHDRRIACLDVKPENLLLDQWGYAKLCDLGIGRQLAAQGDRGLWEFVGTPEYMCPEVIAREPVAPSTTGVAGPDLWAVGVLVAELLVGETPFASDDNADTIAAITKFAAEERKRRGALHRKYQRWSSVARTVKRASTFDPSRAPDGGDAAGYDDDDDEEDEDAGEGTSDVFRPLRRLSPAARELVVKLLRPSAQRRLGCGKRAGGARRVMAHAWFAPIDFDLLRARQLRSPFVPNPVTLAPPFRGEDVAVDITRAKPLTLTELQRAQNHVRGHKESGSVVDAKRGLWKGFSPALVSASKLDKNSPEFAATLQHVRELFKGDD